MKYHYVYRITNKIENKHYYGCRTSRIEPKNDLGIKYFSSSTDKEFIKDQKRYRDNFKYKVIMIFSNREDAIHFEIKLHKKFNVGMNESFYNKVKQTSCGFDTSGIKLSELRSYEMSNETKEKLRKANLGKKDSEETKRKKREKLLGRIVTEETKKKISIKNSQKKRTMKEKEHLSKINTGKKHSNETKNKISQTLTGIDRGDEWRNKMSLVRTGVSTPIPKILCSICGRTISKNNFKRHKCLNIEG